MADGQRVQTVSLGCGTLILIALIVLLFSSRGGDSAAVHDLQTQVHDLQTQIMQLQHQIEGQTADIKLMRERINQVPAK